MRPFCVLFALSVVACAAGRPNVPSAVAEREILDFERAWGDAELHRDATALDAIFDDRFVFTYGSERPLDKATVLKNVLSNDRPPAQTLSERQVIVEGDVAVTTGVDTVDAVVDGKLVKKADRYTTTLVRRNGRWRALAVHMVAIPVP